MRKLIGLPVLKLFLIIGLCISLVGCATTRRLQQISLGMTKDEVVTKIGNPTVVRGCITNKHGQVVEVWEYNLRVKQVGVGEVVGKTFLAICTLGISLAISHPRERGAEKRDYWLYFINDKLVQWGQAGDWKTEADRIYEFRFDTGEKLEK